MESFGRFDIEVENPDIKKTPGGGFFIKTSSLSDRCGWIQESYDWQYVIKVLKHYKSMCVVRMIVEEEKCPYISDRHRSFHVGSGIVKIIKEVAYVL